MLYTPLPSSHFHCSGIYPFKQDTAVQAVNPWTALAYESMGSNIISSSYKSQSKTLD